MASWLGLLTAILLVSITQLAQHVHGSRVAAWYHTGLEAPQIISFGQSRIFYSLCNSVDTPVFPDNETAAFDLERPLRDYTNIAGVGFQRDGVNHAAIFYQANTQELVGAVYACGSDGYYEAVTDETWIIADGVDPPVRGGAGMSAVYLEDAEEIRFYFKTAEAKTWAKSYNIADESPWEDLGVVSPDERMAFSLASARFDQDHISVINPLSDNTSIEASTFQGSDEWTINTFPVPLQPVEVTTDGTTTSDNTTNLSDPEDFTQNNASSLGYSLEAWSSGDVKLGLVYTSKMVRRAYYVGTDKNLHSLSDESGDWMPVDAQDSEFWPLSERENCAFGTASDPANDKIWIFYPNAGGTMTMIHQSALDVWDTAVPLPASPPDSDDGEDDESTGSSGELSTGAKAGIGIGVSVAVLAIIGAVVFFILRSKRRKQASGPQELQAISPATEKDIESSRSTDYSPPAQPIFYEMPENTVVHEMSSNEMPMELPATESPQSAVSPPDSAYPEAYSAVTVSSSWERPRGMSINQQVSPLQQQQQQYYP